MTDPTTVDAGVSFWISVVAAVVLTGVLCLEGRTVLRLRRAGLRTDGRVIDNVDRTPGHRSKRTWRPVIAFTDIEGYHVEFTPRAGSGRGMPLGHTVKVIYLRDRPWAARTDSWASLWLTSTLLSVALVQLGWAVTGLGAQVMAAGGA